jgi:hypothetical protein
VNNAPDTLTQGPLCCPLTGVVVDADDVDGLVDIYEHANDFHKRLGLFLHLVRRRLAALAFAASEDKEAVTQRVRGNRRLVRVSMPDVSFEQRALKDIVCTYPPELVSPVIVIDTYRVAMREFKKLATQSGPQQFLAFRAALEASCRGRVGTPAITIEDDLVSRQS